jgi:hypothetical protein
MFVHCCVERHGDLRALVALELTKLAFANAPVRQFRDEEDALLAIVEIYDESLRLVARLERGDGA